ncbi:hypothetical protein M3Y99_01475600 [Aphelenchoides fujianensis]|nr:hypothetical protein M3Y99_01475600 [Aphelenchoides fujianensis]
MSRMLVAVLALAAMAVYVHSLQCWVGQKDPNQPPFEWYANCDLNGFCQAPGPVNVSTYVINCCTTDLCNDLQNVTVQPMKIPFKP